MGTSEHSSCRAAGLGQGARGDLSLPVWLEITRVNPATRNVGVLLRSGGAIGRGFDARLGVLDGVSTLVLASRHTDADPDAGALGGMPHKFDLTVALKGDTLTGMMTGGRMY